MADTVQVPSHSIAIVKSKNLVPTINVYVGVKLRQDPEALETASEDYGHIVRETPAAVLYPTSVNDITALVKSSYTSSQPFTIAARGQGHSVRGQAMACKGVVIEMTALKGSGNGKGVQVSSPVYADVGGEQLWIDVLSETLKHGLTPVSWTDYLYLTVGGTLSNAGISGQTFRYGPQISNVLEMDVITGKGEMLTCSMEKKSELFYGVLGGLGQFGVITRARIVLGPAPKRVKWVRMLYCDFNAFTKDQERLISIEKAPDYLEGSVILPRACPDDWRSSFFPSSDHKKITSLLSLHGIIYCLEVAKFYDQNNRPTIHQELKHLYLDFIPGFLYEKDVSYLEFLNRVRIEELKLRSRELWDVSHPWLNLFVPKARISDFSSGVFNDIVLKNNITTGPVLVYPMLRSKWDKKMSTVIPEDEDDIFYTVGFLHSCGYDEYEEFDNQNKQVLEFCDKAGIKVKQYLPHYRTKEEWTNHFGSKWTTFQERKYYFDPKMILAPAQGIFRNTLSCVNHNPLGRFST